MTNRKVGNYAIEDSLDRAELHQAEIERLAAGHSDAFQNAVKSLLAGKSKMARVQKQSWQGEERAALAEIAKLLTRRGDRLRQVPVKKRASLRLQIWRMVHIPLAVLTVVVVPLHVLVAYPIWPKIDPSHGFESSTECADCHKQIVDQWRDSMHANAARSPVAIVQNNRVARETLPNGANDVCVNCHNPVGSLITQTVTWPAPSVTGSFYDTNEGVGCAACHQFNARTSYANHEASLWGHNDNSPAGTKFPQSGLGAFQDYLDNLNPGWSYYGAPGAAGNGAHISAAHELYERPHELCGSCHNVTLDRNGDGRIDKGTDLVLQTIYQEFEQFQADGGVETCADCHMPEVIPTVDAAIPLINQDVPTGRTTRSHSFVGVDYPLNLPKTEVKRTHRKERELLLGGCIDGRPECATAGILSLPAAKLSLQELTFTSEGLSFDAQIQALRTGHSFPSGFAFARQVWIEVIVKDQRGNIVFSSGLLNNDSTSDLCDSDSFNGVFRSLMQDCDTIDRQLVNLQGRLIDKVESAGKKDYMGNNVLRAEPGAVEIVLQSIDAGAVARIRPFDGKPLTPLQPPTPKLKSIPEAERPDRARYPYLVPRSALRQASSVTVQARLRFRNLPPYFVRALADGALPEDGPDLLPLVNNLQVVDVSSAQVRAQLR
ncbi:MAG: hypothetical protein ACI9MC_001621 [Kiritimatiellia bacterium]|jgi:hypothetical protein